MFKVTGSPHAHHNRPTGKKVFPLSELATACLRMRSGLKAGQTAAQSSIWAWSVTGYVSFVKGTRGLVGGTRQGQLPQHSVLGPF